MRQSCYRYVCCLAAMLLGGCGSSEVTVVEEPQPAAPSAPVPASISDQIELSLTELMARPRSDLARMADELATKIDIQLTAHRTGRLTFALLPDYAAALSVPVLGQAKFSTQLGFSIPPYLADGTRDGDIALHLARHGDVEAARKLVNPADPALSSRIEACRYERNYPVEWTRVVGLLLHGAQIRLATGDVEGATELAALHKQVWWALDARARDGALGAALLGRGRNAFTLAAAAWSKQGRPDLSRQAEGIVATWGGVPAPTTGLQPGMSKSETSRVLGGTPQGHALLAPSIPRALDLMALPVPPDGTEAVVACFDVQDKLSQVVITYRQGIRDRYQAADLVRPFEDHKPAVRENDAASWIRQQTHVADSWQCDALLARRGDALGALVTLTAPHKAPALSADFGSVNLERSFDSNRILLAPEQGSASVHTERPKALAQLKSPVKELKPAQAVLDRDGADDIAARLTLNYAPVKDMPELHKLIVPLLIANGPVSAVAAHGEQGDALALIWEDQALRYTLHLPIVAEKQADFMAESRLAGKDGSARAGRAAEFDREERQARFKAEKLQTRLPRTLEGDVAQLGATRSELLVGLAARQNLTATDIPGGVSLLFAGDPPAKAAYVARQVFWRFDKTDHLVEVRIRYQDGPASTGPGVWSRDLVNGFKSRAGAPRTGTSSWTNTWSDMPARKTTPALYLWRDDTTVLAFQCDGNGAEVVLRDCPLAHPEGVPLPPFEYLPRGTAGMRLGALRDDVLRSWKGAKPENGPDGSLVFTLPKTAEFDTISIWFDMNRVTRILARHRDAGSGEFSELVEKLSDAWSSKVQALGWPRRQDSSPQQLLQSLGWQDERTRVRLFWEKPGKEKGRLFTEWKELNGQ